jgi:hypothetical protein
LQGVNRLIVTGASGTVLDAPELQTDGEELLLGTVVKIAFDPTAFSVTGVDKPPAGVAELDHLGLDECREPGLLEGQAAGRRGRGEQLGLLVQGHGVVSMAIVVPSRSTEVTARPAPPGWNGRPSGST